MNAIEAATPRTLTLRDLARRWAIPVKRVRMLVAVGKVRAITLGPRCRRVLVAEAERIERAGGI